MNFKISFLLTVTLLATAAKFESPAFAGTARASTEPTPIVELVQRHYFEGLPFAEVSRHDSAAAISELVPMLFDDSHAQFWTNIVTALGMLGDESAIEPLLERVFAERSEADPISHYRAVTAVPIALGYIANLSGGDYAMTKLIEATDASSWSRMGVRWESPVESSAAARNKNLSEMAVLGLAVSGDDRAVAAIDRWQARRTANAPKGRPRTADDFARRARDELQRVSTLGLACYLTEACNGGQTAH